MTLQVGNYAFCTWQLGQEEKYSHKKREHGRRQVLAIVATTERDQNSLGKHFQVFNTWPQNVGNKFGQKMAPPCCIIP